MRFLINFFKTTIVFGLFGGCAYIGYHLPDWLLLLGINPELIFLVFILLLIAGAAAIKTSWECRK